MPNRGGRPGKNRDDASVSKGKHMFNRAKRAGYASAGGVRAALVYALAGGLAGVMGVAGPVAPAWAQRDDAEPAMPTLTPEMQAQLDAIMKQMGEGEQPEDEKADQPGKGEKPKVVAPGEKSKELSGEESIARFQSLLQRRPFHGPAFNGLVEEAVKRGKLPELVKEYQAKVAALPDQVALKIILARLQLRAGDAAGAGEILKGIERLPSELSRQQSELLVLKAEVFQKSGDNDSAERVLKEAQGLAGSVSEQLRLGEALADLYLRGGKKDEAVASLEALAAKFPENYLHQKAVATAMTQRGLHEAAVKRYGEMLKLVGNEVDRKCEVLRELGNAQEKLGKREEAIAAYVEAIGLLASDHWLQKELHERVVTLYRASNKLDELAKYCEAQIKRAPEQTGMRVLLADVQGAMQKVDEGKQTLATAVELFPKDLALSTKRVEFLERAGDVAGASAEYQRAIGQHPQDTELMISYGQFLANNHQVDGARGQWRQVLGSRVDDPTLALRLGSLFEAYELYDDAGEAYERAIAVQPKQADAYVALSRMWLLKGDQEKSAAVLDRLGAANPNDSTVQAALAGALRSLGKLDAALAAISKACEIAPDQVKYAAVKAELLIASGQLEQALEVRRGLVDKAQGAVQQAEAVSTLVSMYASAQKLDALVAAEQKRVDAKPEDVTAWLILAKAADSQRDFVAMRKALDAILKAQPGQEQALTQLAKLQDATGDIDAAIATYAQLIQAFPQRARQFYESIVDVRVRSGDKAGAVTTLEAMAAADPTNVATQCAVAEQMVRMDEAERALPYYEKALRAQPDRHEARLDYGKGLATAGRYEDAAAAFKAVALQRTDMDRAQEALAKLHETCTQLGTLEELMDELHQQVEVDPHNTLVARALTQLLVSELEYGRAMELLDMVLRHNPRDADLAMARAELLRRLAKFDEAIDAYQKVLRFPQIDRDYVLGELGKTQFESGQVDQARRLWKQIQHKMYAGTLLKNNGMLDEAVGVLEEGIRQKPDDYALHRNLVAALEAAGKTPEALNAARRLLDLEPGNIWNIEKLATAYLKSGDRAGAASVAARLFSAGVGEDKTQQKGGGYGSFSSAMQSAAYAQYYSAYGYGGYGQSRSNLERGVQFFIENGLIAELEEVLTKQLAAQPDNAVLKEKAADLFGSQLNKPEIALSMLRELETAMYPVEHQAWLGKSSQKDYLRVEQYNLIARKPALRDAELSRLNAKKQEELARDELLELAVIRQAEGNTEQATQLLTRVVQADANDTLAIGILVDLLVSGEKFAEAEPHARKLVELLGAQRDGMRAGTIERVRREFVRTLPLELQLRVTEDLLADIADKWTLGSGWSYYGAGTQAPGYLRAKLTLGTILAETKRMEDARAIWKELTPKRGPDVDRWTMLGDTAQLHKQDDLAFEFYQEGLKAAGKVAGDQLLQQVYLSSNAQRSWYGEENTVDQAFSSIVDAFSKRDALVQLYDFLRNTDQEARARRVADEYKLHDQLKELYGKRVDEAAAAFKASTESPLKASVGYFAAVCKLAEVYDRSGDWDGAQKVYERYCADFPDELGLLQTLGEVAQARQKMDEAIAWEKKVLECKARLAKKAREWSMRDLAITPSRPQPLTSARNDYWSWGNRWGGSQYGYGSGRGAQLDRSSSWLRLAQLYLAEKNEIAAGDAMQRAVGESTGRRHELVRQVTEMIQQRQLVAKMLPVLRTLAVYAPADEKVQLAFSDSLESAGKKELAVEVCNRLLRRGLSDLGTLAEVKRRLAALSPEAAAPEVTLASLEAESAAAPENLKTKLRLAKAYYYSLEVEKSAAILEQLAKDAPHLEGLHELLVEVYTLKGDSEKLVAALKLQIEKTSDDRQKRQLRWRLVDELLTSGKDDEALATVKDLGDPRDPTSYVRIGTLLQYFGKYDEAVAALGKAKSSQRRNPYGGDTTDFAVPQAMALQGDFAEAAKKIMDAVSEQSKQQVQYGGMSGMYERDGGSPFASIEHVFALYPALATEVEKLVEEKRAAAPTDAQVLKLVTGLQKSMGRSDKAEALLEKQVDEGSADQNMVAKQIDIALSKKDFDKAIALAEKFIANQPKQVSMPGMPAQYAAYAALQSPRAFMLCKLGDVYWDKGDKDKAFETYKQLIDSKIEETKTAYATICLVRGRIEEARKLIDDALAIQKVKTPALLQFKAAVAALAGKPEEAFDAVAEAAKHETGEQDPYSFRGGGAGGTELLAVIARKSGQIDKYAALLREKIKKNPSDWNNYSTLIRAYEEAGRPEDALAVTAEAEKIPALMQEALHHRIQKQASTASLDDLIAGYQKLVELQEKNVATDGGAAARYGYEPQDSAGVYREVLAGLYWEKGDSDKAVATLLERANLQKAATHLGLAAEYVRQEAYEDAAKSYQRAIDLDPENINARTGLASLAYASGDRKAMLPHMLSVFNKRGVQDESSRNRSYSYYGGEDQEQEVIPPAMTQWAAALMSDPSVMDYLEKDAGDKAGEYRIMLGALTGDWVLLEQTLKPKVEGGSHDPQVWTLWAKVQQRKGDWAEAAKALSYLKSSKLTSIAQYRDRLKLVLAGKQFKEAAAGTRQAQPGAGMTAQPMPGGGNPYGYSSRYGDYWSPSGSDLLPTLYLKLGDTTKAERLYLVSGNAEGVEGKLPRLAMLMWDLGKKDRALELMRQAVVGSASYGRNMLGQYAAMLAEAGKVDDAIDLLVRAYRWDSSGDGSSMYDQMYQQRGGQEQLERGQGSVVASSLFELLMKQGRFEATLKNLEEQSAKDPADPRLAQLVMSLQKRGARWESLKTSVAGWQAAKPGDLAIKMEHFHTCCQLGQYDDALKLLEEIKKDAPTRTERWAVHEAFVLLLKDDVEKAVVALEPVLASDGAEEQEPESASMLLACVGRLEKVVAWMDQKKAAGELEPQQYPALARLYMATGKKDAALALTLDQFWKSPQLLTTSSPGFDTLCRLAADGLKPSSSRPADAALMVLATEGPAEGHKAFKALAANGTPSVEAQRGLILAAELAGDFRLAAATNDQLVSWLEARREAAWYSNDDSTLQQMAKKMLDQSSRYGTSQIAMAGAMGGQMWQGLEGRGRSRPPVQTYAQLWATYARHAQDLLAREGDAEKLRGLARLHARTLGGSGNQDEYAYYQQMTRYASMGLPAPNWGQRRGSGGNWRAEVRQSLWECGHFDALQKEYETLGARTTREEWTRAGSVAAAAGKVDQAQQWRARLAESVVATLQASDTPDLGSSTRDPWRWYYGSSNSAQELMRVRSALRASAIEHEVEDQQEFALRDGADSLWELAMVDPAVEQRLLALAKDVGPGWGTTRTFGQLLAYFQVKRDHKKVIELIEKAYEPDKLLTSQQLSQYVQACYRDKAFDKLEKVLADAERTGSTMKKDVTLSRLVILRLTGKSAEADALETKLLGLCVTEPRTSHRLPEDLAEASAQWQGGYDYPQIYESARSLAYGGAYPSYAYGQYYNDDYQWRQPMSDQETISGLAQAIGVRFDPKVREEDLTLTEVREAYLQHGLWLDGVRLLDKELPELTDPRDTRPLLHWKAYAQRRAGKAAEAQQTAAALEKILLDRIKAAPGDADRHVELAQWYLSKEWGEDFAKAFQAVQAAKLLNPGCDQDGGLTVHCLYKLNRHKEAVEAWKAAALTSGEAAYKSPIIYYAALSADQAGDKELGARLARLALYTSPGHKLAAKAQELIK